MSHVLRATILTLAVFALAACGTTSGEKKNGSSKTNPATVADTKAAAIYHEGLSLVTAGKASADRCLGATADFKGKSWKALVRHANGCVKTGDWRRLELTAQELATVEIASPWGAYFYSLAAEQMNDLPRAIWMVELALRKAPDAALFRYQKGRVLWKLKNHKDGVDEIAAAAKLDPKMGDAHVFLAQIYHRELVIEKAASHYEMALSVDGRNLICLEGLADIRVAQGKAEKAAVLYTEAVSLSGDDARLRLKLAQAHEAIPANQELALANYRAARDLASKGKKVALSVDVNDKIKMLETKVMESKAGKQAQVDEARAKSASDRAPVSESQRRTTK